MVKKIFLGYLFFIFYIVHVDADTVLLKNGDRISGKISLMQNNELKLITPYSEMKIPWTDINEIYSEEPITIELLDGSILKGMLIKTNNGASINNAELSEPVLIDMHDIKEINPPIVSNDVVISGGVHIGGSIAKGNTDTQEFHADAEIIARTENHKFTVGAEYNQTANNSSESSNNLFVYSKYDHYFTESWYASLFAEFTKDRFQDLNFRSAFGAGIGHEIWNTEVSFLSAEIGAAYTREDYKPGEDREFIAGRWALDYHYWLFADRLQFFHNHIGLVSFDDFSDILLRTHTGLKYPIYQGFDLLTQIDLDYDNKPAENTTSTDTRYIVGLGYVW